jgi:putative heme-binding domain-containing protein
LFKISYTDKAAPQPVLAHPYCPMGIRIVFDRLLKADADTEFTNECSITMGRYVTAGEPFESFRPGYQVVKNQRTMPRFALPVESVRVRDDKQSLFVLTSGVREGANYALSLPASIAGQPMDLKTDLTGVNAVWEPSNVKETWNGWLPHLDLVAARGLTVGSRDHEQFFKNINRRGTLTLRGRLDLYSMLHPAVQPESKLDYEYPAELVTVVLKSNAKLDLKVGTNVVSTGRNEARITTQPRENRWLPLEVSLATGGGEPRLDVSWFTAEDPRPRPLPLRRILLPWAQPYLAAAVVNPTPELESASWQRGKELFFGDRATCYKCHQIRGDGGTIGADLSNLIYRDYASVLKDITEPSGAINPDHIAYNVQLTDGEVETGVLVKNSDEEVVLGQVSGKNLTIPKAKVASMKASAISLMPEGLLKGLTEQEQKDLMKFLLTVQ